MPHDPRSITPDITPRTAPWSDGFPAIAPRSGYGEEVRGRPSVVCPSLPPSLLRRKGNGRCNSGWHAHLGPVSYHHRRAPRAKRAPSSRHEHPLPHGPLDMNQLCARKMRVSRAPIGPRRSASSDTIGSCLSAVPLFASALGGASGSLGVAGRR